MKVGKPISPILPIKFVALAMFLERLQNKCSINRPSQFYTNPEKMMKNGPVLFEITTLECRPVKNKVTQA